MNRSLIVAVSSNGIIGANGQLPWKLPADLRHFRRLTMGHTLLMGRRTYQSLGRPLPGRRNLVVSRDPHFAAPGCETFSSIDDAFAAASADEQLFVIGGREIYRQCLPLVDRLYWTHVLAEVAGDTRFPQVHWQQWKLIEQQSYAADERNEHPFVCRLFQRLAPDRTPDDK